jgi:hypothetical protein
MYEHEVTPEKQQAFCLMMDSAVVFVMSESFNIH